MIRPVLVGLCSVPVRLPRGERNFVLFAGLKGAVPILLGSFLLAAGTPGRQRLRHLRRRRLLRRRAGQPGARRRPPAAVPMRTVEPEPWALGVRLQDEPRDCTAHVTAGSPADGRAIADLPCGDAWVSLVIRDGTLLP